MDIKNRFSGARRLDASAGQAGYLLQADSGTPVRLSPSAYHLLRAVGSGISFEVLAEKLGQQHGRSVSAGELERAYRRLVKRLDRATRPTAHRLSPGFRFRVRLLPQSTVLRIAGRLAVLFRARWALGLLLAAVASLYFLHSRTSDSLIGAEVFWPAYGLFLVSLLAHELGHASACAHYGARPSDIGVVVYLVFPSFYSNVTRAWQLSRWQRVVVDLGGLHFQLIVGAVYALLGWASGWAPFQAAVWMILLSCLISLNPVLRCDGYWALADALGVIRLDREPGRLLRYLAGRCRGLKGQSWPWPAGITTALAAYTVLALCGWSYVLYRLAPEIWHRAADYPRLALSVIYNSTTTGLLEVEALRSFVVSTLMLIISSLMIRQLFLCTASLLGPAVRHG